MELEISKFYFSNSFHRMPSKLYEDIGYHGNRQSFAKFMALCNFNMGVNVWHFEILTWESMGKPNFLVSFDFNMEYRENG